LQQISDEDLSFNLIIVTKVITFILNNEKSTALANNQINREGCD